MNVIELRNDLIKVYEELRKNAIGTNEAKQLSNVAGKVISTAKVQLEYNKMTGSNSNKIKFLDVNE